MATAEIIVVMQTFTVHHSLYFRPETAPATNRRRAARLQKEMTCSFNTERWLNPFSLILW